MRPRFAVSAALAALVLGAAAIVWVAGDDQEIDWAGATESIPDRAPVAVFPARDARLANAHLDRRRTPGPVTSDTVWLVLAPRRVDGDLVPARPRAIGPPDFARRSIRRHRGFQVVELRAPGPRTFVPIAFGSPPPALLAPG